MSKQDPFETVKFHLMDGQAMPEDEVSYVTEVVRKALVDKAPLIVLTNKHVSAGGDPVEIMALITTLLYFMDPLERGLVIATAQAFDKRR